MSESMIERVAKAIYDRGSVLGKSWDDTEQGHRDFYRDLARVAIEAMREPTEAMLDEGPPPPYMEKHVWARMIDAALKEHET